MKSGVVKAHEENQILMSNELKAKCVVLKRRATEAEIRGRAYCHGIDVQNFNNMS